MNKNDGVEISFAVFQKLESEQTKNDGLLNKMYNATSEILLNKCSVIAFYSIIYCTYIPLGKPFGHNGLNLAGEQSNTSDSPCKVSA